MFRADRHASALRLDADESRQAGRVANRPPAIAAERHRTHPRRDGGGRPTGRTARRSLRVPRVPRHAPALRRGPRPQRQLGDVGLADDDRTGSAKPPDNCSVSTSRLAVGSRAPRSHLPRDVGVVLDRDRDPEKRQHPGLPAPAGVDPVGCRERVIGEHDAEGIDHRVDLLDP